LAGLSVHRLTRVDGRPKVDQARAPAWRGEGHGEREGRERTGCDDRSPLSSALGRPVQLSASEDGEPERRQSVDGEPELERGLGPKGNDEDKPREHGTGDAAERVERVGGPNVGAPRSVAWRRQVREDRKAQPHAESWNEHDG